MLNCAICKSFIAKLYGFKAIFYLEWCAWQKKIVITLHQQKLSSSGEVSINADIRLGIPSCKFLRSNITILWYAVCMQPSISRHIPTYRVSKKMPQKHFGVKSLTSIMTVSTWPNQKLVQFWNPQNEQISKLTLLFEFGQVETEKIEVKDFTPKCYWGIFWDTLYISWSVNWWDE